MTEPRPRQRQRPSSASAKASPKETLAGPARLRPGAALRNASPTGPRTDPPESQPVGFICPPCGRFIRTDLDGVLWQARTGSPARFCSPGCRQAALRRRRAGVDEGVRLQQRCGRNRSLDGRNGAGDE
ncbi:MAG: hypothetical protein NVSMB12_22270 [Acidimicrobiales bacterium]